MAAWTKATLATRVLEHLGIVGTGQSANATHQARVEEVIDSVHPLLAKDGVAPYVTSSIPERYQHPMVAYVAHKVAPRFGFRGGILNDLRMEAQEAVKDMYKASAAHNHNEPVVVDYF